MFVDSQTIKGIALRVGFDDCGISDAEVDNDTILALKNWLAAERNAGMSYMERNIDVRSDLGLLVEGAKSVISVLYSYNTDEKPDRNDIKIAKYALGRDYHYVLKEKLNQMLEEIKKVCPRADGRAFVDSAPLFERYFAQKSGLGFIGRNKCIINPKLGSFVFIGELVVNFESDYDQPLNQTCLGCNACIKACPTKALTLDGINAANCISYQTIEKKDSIDDDVRQAKGSRIYGCDACQDCCPHNFSAPKKNGIILPEIKAFSPEELESMSNHLFQKKFANTALLRAGRKKILENCNS
jgi:epoxyqueuosine reductase